MIPDIIDQPVSSSRQVGQLRENVQDYERMLRYLSGIVDLRTAEQIEALLDKYSVDVDGSSSNSHSTPQVKTPHTTDELASLASVYPLESNEGADEGQSNGGYWGPLQFEDLVSAQALSFADQNYPNLGVPFDHMVSVANGSADDMCCPTCATIHGYLPYTNHSPWGWC
ncbi:Transcription factor [Penicillium lividum]|nr:Transcription factor [Penicillium lividum]